MTRDFLVTCTTLYEVDSGYPVSTKPCIVRNLDHAANRAIDCSRLVQAASAYDRSFSLPWTHRNVWRHSGRGNMQRSETPQQSPASGLRFGLRHRNGIGTGDRLSWLV